VNRPRRRNIGRWNNCWAYWNVKITGCCRSSLMYLKQQTRNTSQMIWDKTFSSSSRNDFSKVSTHSDNHLLALSYFDGSINMSLFIVDFSWRFHDKITGSSYWRLVVTDTVLMATWISCFSGINKTVQQFYMNSTQCWLEKYGGNNKSVLPAKLCCRYSFIVKRFSHNFSSV